MNCGGSWARANPQPGPAVRVSLGSILGWLHHDITHPLGVSAVPRVRGGGHDSLGAAGVHRHRGAGVPLRHAAPLLASSPLSAVSSRSTGLGGWVNDTSRLHFHTPTTSAASSLTPVLPARSLTLPGPHGSGRPGCVPGLVLPTAAHTGLASRCGARPTVVSLSPGTPSWLGTLPFTVEGSLVGGSLARLPALTPSADPAPPQLSEQHRRFRSGHLLRRPPAQK